MNKNLYLLALASALLAAPRALYAEYMNVPEDLRSHAVYYVRTKQLDLFSCGYNVVFNAANFETTLGLENPAHKYPVFYRKVMPYVQRLGLHPRGSSTNEQSEYLAKHLKLQPFYQLDYTERSLYGIAPFIKHVEVSYPRGTSQREIQRLFDEAFSAKQNSTIRQIHGYLRANEYAVVHFSCHVDDLDDGHAILVSLHQNESGRGLFVFDNTNYEMRPSSEIVRFIEYLIYMFNISPHYSFSPPWLPNRWLHLD